VSCDYPLHLICQHLEAPHSSDGKIRLHVMLMVFIGYVVAQCKFGGLKNGGYGGCIQHEISIELRRNVSKSMSNLLFCNICRETRHSLMIHSYKIIQIATSHW
jgi:hypothetical protein